MSRIIRDGTARNVTTVPNKQELDPSERRFVTFTNDLGSVHTIIVDVEHVANDAKTLIAWFDHTRTLVEHESHLSPTDVLKQADEAIGAADRATASGSETATQGNQGGGY